MKIIKKDNFDRERFSEMLVCENVSEWYGKVIVDALNEKLGGENSEDYFALVKDDYKLLKFEP